MKYFLPLIAAVLLTSGCFEMREEINMKADGSGELLLTFDLRESAVLLRQYLRAGKVDGEDLPTREEMQSMIPKVESEIAAMPGIGDVNISSNWTDFVFKFRCRFDKVEFLDNALFELAKNSKTKQGRPLQIEPNFRYRNGIFSRFFKIDNPGRAFSEMPADRRVMLEKARYLIIYRFENAIASFSNEHYQLSASGKAMMFQSTFAEIVKSRRSPATEVVFK